MTTNEFESYDQIKDKVKKEYNRFKESAKSLIPKAVNALKIEEPRRQKEEIKDIILKDFLSYWSRRTIMDALGDEFKDKEQQEAGKKGDEKKKEIELIQQNSGTSSTSNDENRAATIAAKNLQQTVTENENITKDNQSTETPESSYTEGSQLQNSQEPQSQQKILSIEDQLLKETKEKFDERDKATRLQFKLDRAEEKIQKQEDIIKEQSKQITEGSMKFYDENNNEITVVQLLENKKQLEEENKKLKEQKQSQPSTQQENAQILELPTSINATVNVEGRDYPIIIRIFATKKVVCWVDTDQIQKQETARWSKT